MIPPADGPDRRCTESTMKYHKLEGDSSLYQSNIRAEDGIQDNSRWNTLYEGVLIPCGFLFAFLLALLIVVLIRG